jgi:hypothetical protein
MESSRRTLVIGVEGLALDKWQVAHVPAGMEQQIEGPDGNAMSIVGSSAGMQSIKVNRSKATFVARLQPSQLPSQAARQLPDSIDNYPG